MLDLSDNKQKIIDAALKLAESDGWRGLSLDRIANRAGVSLVEFRRLFSSKAEILTGFTRMVDEKGLAQVTPADAEISSRDRLFDVLMTRFELMGPYKGALKRIRDDLRFHPAQATVQLGAAARSLYWMMVAAGIDAEGGRGALRLPGLIAVYGQIFDIWLDDDDPGMARTMAALDSRLRRGERIIQRADDLGEAARSFCDRIFWAKDRMRSKKPVPETETPAPQAGPATNGSGGPGPAPAI
ncbi:MAG: TetR/AcrR family transcriptional regulator [Hyphomicrobiales bacterium]|nr:TetR/AcrR family transcriptional regulator [Hyphomicrobiales bacterium]